MSYLGTYHTYIGTLGLFLCTMYCRLRPRYIHGARRKIDKRHGLSLLCTYVRTSFMGPGERRKTWLLGVSSEQCVVLFIREARRRTKDMAFSTCLHWHVFNGCRHVADKARYRATVLHCFSSVRVCRHLCFWYAGKTVTSSCFFLIDLNYFVVGRAGFGGVCLNAYFVNISIMSGCLSGVRYLCVVGVFELAGCNAFMLPSFLACLYVV